MKPTVPSVVVHRPPFWPWANGQSISVSDDYMLNSDSLLLLWHMLAPSTPVSGWDAGPLLDVLGVPHVAAPVARDSLALLEKYKLARFEPEFTAWCKNHPLMQQKAKKPPVLGWKLSAQHLDVWWHLQHPDSARSWHILQAMARCSSWSEERVDDLRQNKLADRFVRLAPRG